MLRLLMKHIVAEAAIDVFFKTVFNNFIKPKVTEKIRIEFASRLVSVDSRKLASSYTLEPVQPIQMYPASDEILEEMYSHFKQEIIDELNGMSKEELLELKEKYNV